MSIYYACLPRSRFIEIARQVVSTSTFARFYDDGERVWVKDPDDPIYEAEDVARYPASGVPEMVHQITPTILDTFSASALTTVYDNLNEINRQKLMSMPPVRQVDVAFKTLERANRR